MSEEEPKLTKKQQLFIDYYLRSFNASEAARKAGYSEKTAYAMGWENLRKPEIKAAINARLDEVHLSADEALKMNADIAHGTIGTFFKVVDEWMFNPLPSYEILDEKEVLDQTQTPPRTRVSYRVRHVVMDMDKVIDPQYSHLIREFSDSKRSGLSVKLHDKATAIDRTLRVAGKYRDTLDLTNSDGSLKPPSVIEIIKHVEKDNDETA